MCDTLTMPKKIGVKITNWRYETCGIMFIKTIAIMRNQTFRAQSSKNGAIGQKILLFRLASGLKIIRVKLIFWI